MGDSLCDVYHIIQTSKQLWEAFEKKYKSEVASIKTHSWESSKTLRWVTLFLWWNKWNFFFKLLLMNWGMKVWGWMKRFWLLLLLRNCLIRKKQSKVKWNPFWVTIHGNWLIYLLVINQLDINGYLQRSLSETSGKGISPKTRSRLGCQYDNCFLMGW